MTGDRCPSDESAKRGGGKNDSGREDKVPSETG